MAIVMCDRTDKDGVRHLFAWEVDWNGGKEAVCSCVGKVNHRGVETFWMGAAGRQEARIYVGQAEGSLDIWLYSNGAVKEEAHEPVPPSRTPIDQSCHVPSAERNAQGTY